MAKKVTAPKAAATKTVATKTVARKATVKKITEVDEIIELGFHQARRVRQSFGELALVWTENNKPIIHPVQRKVFPIQLVVELGEIQKIAIKKFNELPETDKGKYTVNLVLTTNEPYSMEVVEIAGQIYTKQMSSYPL